MLDGILSEVISKKGENYKIRIVGEREDLQFKIISEKLKNEPIKADTVIDIKYYRLITGACETGIKHWMEQNSIKKDKYKAKDLLPLLEKTNAYGLDKFKSLITF